MKDGELLKVHNLTGGYEGHTVLFDVNLSLKAGEIVALVGPNGCGKSTLLKCLAGLLTHWSGSAMLLDRPINGLLPDEIRRLGISYTMQDEGVFRSMTVKENLEIASSEKKDRSAIAKQLSRVREIFPFLHRQWAVPAEKLSGGERKMLSISMALMSNPALLLLDEPLAGLHDDAAAQELKILREVASHGTAILIVEHSPIVLEIARRVYSLDNGRIRCE